MVLAKGLNRGGRPHLLRLGSHFALATRPRFADSDQEVKLKQGFQARSGPKSKMLAPGELQHPGLREHGQGLRPL